MKQNTALTNSLADAFADLFDGGSCKLYSGTQPVDANTAPGGGNTLLCTITLPTPAFGAAAGGVVAKSGTWAASVAAAGVATWARIANAAGTRVFDATVDMYSGELIIDDSNLVDGGYCEVIELTYTVPAE